MAEAKAQEPQEQERNPEGDGEEDIQVLEEDDEDISRVSTILI